MINVEAEVDEDNVLHLRVNLGEENGPSQSGKSTIVGSSQGVKKVPGWDDTRFNLSVFRY